MKQQWILILLASFVFTACGQSFGVLESLGTKGNYSDLEIEDDFKAPEDELSDEPPQVTPPVIVEEPPAVSEDDQPSTVVRDTFYFESQDFSLAHNKARRWGGCQTGFRSVGGYNSDTQCGRAYIEHLFADNLNEVFFQCVINAASKAGYSRPEKVFINHLGSYNDRNARNSTRKSNHAYARALDIKNFNLIDKDGKVQKVSTLLRDYKGSQAIFYDEFRDCWKNSMPPQCKPGQSEYQGSIGHKSSKLGGNTLHNDHIHLSFPICAGAV